MKTKFTYAIISMLAIALFSDSCKKKEGTIYCDRGDSTVTTSKVVATGLNNPRGLKFGPDGYLYVAEAGVGGKNLSNKCTQVIPPVGPYLGSDTGSRISRIDWNGVRTTWVDHLPSSTTAPTAGSGNEGVADLDFVGNTLYALLAGAGCSHAVPDIPNGLIRVNPDRSWTMISNYSSFLMAHPVKNPNADDFEPDGTPYGMTSYAGNLYAIEPNHGELDKFTTGGSISRIIDISASQGHIVPTCVVNHNGDFYVGNLNTFPIVQGSSKVFKITTGGQISVFASGFETILGVLFDNHDRLYVLECTAGLPGLTPGFGDVIRIDPSGKRQVITSGLHLPTAMTFGPDGKLYISDWGIGPAGLGQIVQVSFKCEEVQSDILVK